MLITCNHCRRRVLAKLDNTCPSCNQTIDPEAAAAVVGTLSKPLYGYFDTTGGVSNNTTPEQGPAIEDNKETGDPSATEKQPLRPFTVGIYATRTASGVMCGLAILLGAVLIGCGISLLAVSKNVTPHVAAGFEQRSSTMALWAFTGAFISGFGLGWPSQIFSKNQEKYGCLTLLVAGIITAGIIGGIGCIVLQNAGLYDRSLDTVLLSFGLGLFFGGIAWSWFAYRFY